MRRQVKIFWMKFKNNYKTLYSHTRAHIRINFATDWFSNENIQKLSETVKEHYEGILSTDEIYGDSN